MASDRNATNWGKIAGIVGVVVALLVMISAIAWYVVAGMPQYSLYQAGQAVHQHDYAKFSKYVDSGTIVTTLVDQAVAQGVAQAQAQTSNDPYAQLGQQFAVSLIESIKPQLKQKLSDGLKQQVESGDLSKNYAQPTLRNAFKQTKVTLHGNVADVVATDASGQQIPLKMRKQGHHWQVYEITLKNNPASTK